jgi:hypothetical protein
MTSFKQNYQNTTKWDGKNNVREKTFAWFISQNMIKNIKIEKNHWCHEQELVESKDAWAE